MDKIKKILIAVDDATVSEKVASYGFQLGQQLNAEIGLLSVVDVTYMVTENTMTPEELAEMQEDTLKQSQQMLIYEVFNNHDIKTFVKRGEADEVILQTADEWQADLIVMGTHGRSGLYHLLVGSVAEKVIRHSTKPTFIVPVKS
jgi:nucleotide-binding universal stress UspA family protein